MCICMYASTHPPTHPPTYLPAYPSTPYPAARYIPTSEGTCMFKDIYF